ncbi:MAG: tetratricopeptide repeat protein, partial [Acidobacteria bacterium]|nr:tetratricopeptide repeat protein [Acidobacteriota bacterium]
HKRSAVVALAVLVLAAVVLFWYFMHTRATPILTDKDTILIADFDNTTGDPVFDGALKQALAIQLEQSPFLNIFPQERVRETLRFMNRSPDERVTKDVAREICQRQGLKAYLASSIANLGSHLVITLEAVNAQTGDTLARQQVEAGSKEQVLSALGQAATKLREKLGESLASIQKFDAPVWQATTSSLEAFKAFSLGIEQTTRGKGGLEAIPFYKRAIELDPNFALAYSRLAVGYRNSAQGELASRFSQKAFELRERVTEREKFYITAGYYTHVTRELDKQIEAFDLWKRTYPRDYEPPNSLALRYHLLGQDEKAIEEAREVIRLNPNFYAGYGNLGRALRRLNRFEEAKEVFERALEKKLDATPIRAELYSIAFVQGDTAAMKQQIDSMSGKPDEYVAQVWQAGAAAFSGQSRKAQGFSSRARDLAARRNKEVAAAYAAADALKSAVFGTCQQAKEETAKVLAVAHTEDSLRDGALALA